MQAAGHTRTTPAAAPRPLLDAPRRPPPIADLWRFRQLIALLVVRELKVRYKRSVLGLLWTMLNPLLLMIVYAVVFTTILRAAQPNFSIFLLSGLLPWLYFSTALMQGLMSVLVNQDLIRKVARAEGAPDEELGDAPEDWWISQTKTDPRYDTLLAALAPTDAARQALRQLRFRRLHGEHRAACLRIHGCAARHDQAHRVVQREHACQAGRDVFADAVSNHCIRSDSP